MPLLRRTGTDWDEVKKARIDITVTHNPLNNIFDSNMPVEPTNRFAVELPGIASGVLVVDGVSGNNFCKRFFRTDLQQEQSLVHERETSTQVEKHFL